MTAHKTAAPPAGRKRTKRLTVAHLPALLKGQHVPVNANTAKTIKIYNNMIAKAVFVGSNTKYRSVAVAGAQHSPPHSLPMATSQGLPNDHRILCGYFQTIFNRSSAAAVGIYHFFVQHGKYYSNYTDFTSFPYNIRQTTDQGYQPYFFHKYFTFSGI